MDKPTVDYVSDPPVDDKISLSVLLAPRKPFDRIPMKPKPSLDDPLPPRLFIVHDVVMKPHDSLDEYPCAHCPDGDTIGICISCRRLVCEQCLRISRRVCPLCHHPVAW